VNVLVLAPHPDDESIGCGGTLVRHAVDGDRVVALVLTSGEAGVPGAPPDAARAIREAECRQAVATLGAELAPFARLPDGALADHVDAAAAVVAPLLHDLRPERVYLPHDADGHADHAPCAAILRAAVARTGRPAPWALGYEVWTPMGWFDQPQDVTDTVDRKLAAIAAYRSQLDQFAYDRAAAGLAQYRGALACKSAAAEVFCSIDVG
jgi:LmbE family N-acetylglucosaminyl deacetylase